MPVKNAAFIEVPFFMYGTIKAILGNADDINLMSPHGSMCLVKAGAGGAANVKLVVSGVTLGEGANSLFHPQGTALVIHADPDDGKTDPAGNAGARIACGVITS
jgi:Cu/Zn superoxide dismutase